MLVLRRAVAGQSIAALAADFSWGPRSTAPYHERIADAQEECGLILRRPDGSVLCAVVTFVEDDDRQLLVSSLTLT